MAAYNSHESDECLISDWDEWEDLDLDAEFDEYLQQAANEVTGTAEQNFQCEHCPKQYKTAGGLRRHNVEKHEPEKDPPFNANQLHVIIDECNNSLQCDRNYPENFRAALQGLQFDISNEMLEEINTISAAAEASGDFDKFYAKFYKSFVAQGKLYFPTLSSQLANLLLKKVGERIVKEINAKLTPEPTNPFDTPIKPVEMDVIENMSGHVVKSFLRKFQKRKATSESKQVISILERLVNNKDKENQRLINALDRGRLTATRREVHAIFQVAEEKFRRVNFVKERKMECEMMANDLAKHADILSSYSFILLDVTVDEELASNLLQKMLAYYLKIRTYSAARDITSKHRINNKKKKSKALRKTMKDSEKK